MIECGLSEQNSKLLRERAAKEKLSVEEVIFTLYRPVQSYYVWRHRAAICLIVPPQQDERGMLRLTLISDNRTPDGFDPQQVSRTFFSVVTSYIENDVSLGEYVNMIVRDMPQIVARIEKPGVYGVKLQAVATA